MKQWQIKIEADTPAELREELQAVAAFCHMFPSMITHCENHGAIEVTEQSKIIRTD